MITATSRMTAFFSALLLFALPLAANAVPVTYTITSGALNAVSLYPLSGNQGQTPCAPGVSSCLQSAVAISTGTITIDTTTLEILDLNIFAPGTGVLDMQGLNGYETVEFTGTSYTSGGTGGLIDVGGGQFNISPTIDGLVDVQVVDLFMLGNTSGTPDASVPYMDNPTSPGGSILMNNTAMALTLTGVDIGVFVDPMDPTNQGKFVLAKADFNLTAVMANPIPEPHAALLFGAGFLIFRVRNRR